MVSKEYDFENEKMKVKEVNFAASWDGIIPLDLFAAIWLELL